MFRKSFISQNPEEENGRKSEAPYETVRWDTSYYRHLDMLNIPHCSESESVKKEGEGSQDAWENNSDTPDVTIEINGSSTTNTSTLDGEESSVTEGEENKANLTIDEFLGETETVANDLTEEAEEMFNNLITRATGKNMLKSERSFDSCCQVRPGKMFAAWERPTFRRRCCCRKTCGASSWTCSPASSRASTPPRETARW